MSRFFGVVGYEGTQFEDPSNPGVYSPANIFEHEHLGTIKRRQRKWSESSDSTNDNLVLNSQISIIADDFIDAHWPAIKYVVISGVPFKVTSVDIARPRYFLNLGGVWNGD